MREHRRVQPLAAILVLLGCTVTAHTQKWLVCKRHSSHDCRTWSITVEAEDNALDDLPGEVNTAFVCGYTTHNPGKSHRKFITVESLNNGLPKTIFCKRFHEAESAFDWSNVREELGYPRARRQATFVPRGRYRGQTQSQYLSIDRGNGKDEGKAEALSAADSSRASVSGNSGMGQAQSQSIYDPNCDGCYGKTNEAGSLRRKPGSSGGGNGYGPAWNEPGPGYNQYPGTSYGSGQSPSLYAPGQSPTLYGPGQNGATQRGTGRQPYGTYGPDGRFIPSIDTTSNRDPVSGGFTPGTPGPGGYGPGSQVGGIYPSNTPDNGRTGQTGSGPYPYNGYGKGNGEPDYPSGYRPGTNVDSNFARPGAVAYDGMSPDRGANSQTPGQQEYQPSQNGLTGGESYSPGQNSRFGPTGATGGNYIPGKPGTDTYAGQNGLGRGKPGTGSYLGQDEPYQPGQGVNMNYGPGQTGEYGPGRGTNGNYMPVQPIGTLGNGNIPGKHISGTQNGGTGPGQPGSSYPGQQDLNVGYGPGQGSGLNQGGLMPPGALVAPGTVKSSDTPGAVNPSQDTSILPVMPGATKPSTIGGVNSGYGPGANTGLLAPGPGIQNWPYISPDGTRYICCVVPGQTGTTGYPYGTRQVYPGNQYVQGGTAAPNNLLGPGSKYSPGNFAQVDSNGKPINTAILGVGTGPREHYQPGTGTSEQYGPNDQSKFGGTTVAGAPNGQYGTGGQTATGPSVQYGEPGGQYGPLDKTGAGPHVQYGAGAGAPGGQYGPGSQSVPGSQYGPGSHTGTGQQYGTGDGSGSGLPVGQYGIYGPGNRGGQTSGVPNGQYGSRPGDGSNVGGQYGPSGQTVLGRGGPYGPTGGDASKPGSQYTSGYNPDGTKAGGTSIQYGPGGRYGPGDQGGQYGPGVGTGSQGAQYGPGGQPTVGSDRRYGPGSQYNGQYSPGSEGTPIEHYGPGSNIVGPDGQTGAGPSGQLGRRLGEQAGVGPGGQIGGGPGGQAGGGPGGQVGGGPDGQVGGRPGGQVGGGPGGQVGGRPGGQAGEGPGGQVGRGPEGRVDGRLGSQVGGGPQDSQGGISPNGQYGPESHPGTGVYGPGGKTGIGVPGEHYGPAVGSDGRYGPNGQTGISGPYNTGAGPNLKEPGVQYGPGGKIDGGPGGLYGSGQNGQYGPGDGTGGGTPQYGPNQTNEGGLYGPGRLLPGSDGSGSGITSPRGVDGQYTGRQPGGAYNEVPQNYMDPNISPTADEDDSEAEAIVNQALNGTTASASSKGGNNKGKAQTHVQGTYTGSGSFQAQAQIAGENKEAESEVSGGKKGASSSATGSGRNNKSQASVQLGSATGSVQTNSQTNGAMHSSNSQVQGSVKGGMADAQARGPGSTSSQAQIGFTPYKDSDKTKHELQKAPFVGGGMSSAQSSGRTGQSQSQLHGTFKYGISYNGAAQSGASLDKDAVFPSRLAFDKIDVFDEKDKNINIDITEIPSDPETETIPETTPLPELPVSQEQGKQTTEPVLDETLSNSESRYHPHAEHHKYDVTPAPQGPMLTENRRSFQNGYSGNSGDYEFTTDKDEGVDYDTEGEFASEGAELDQGEYSTYDEYSRNKPTHQSLQSPKRNGLEVRQTSGGNTQHIVLGSLKKHDAEITQKDSERPDEARVYQPGESVPGTGGYTIPIGFTGSVKSVASKDKTYVVGSKNFPSQAQSVTLTPGTGKIKYRYPSGNTKYVSPSNLRSLQNGKRDDDRYVSVSKSVTRALDNDNNIRKQYSHTYYTKSSSCGYFTFTCTMVSSAEGKKKVCKPKVPTNPDGTPIRC